MSQITLRSYWRDNQGKSHYIKTTIPAKNPIKHYEKCWWFPDSGVGVSCSSECWAKQRIDMWARVIRFMDITGLIPSNAWRSLFTKKMNINTMEEGLNPAGFDHTLIWRDSYKNRILTTEPYQHGVDTVLNWAQLHGWSARKCPELGIWYPEGGTTLIFVSPPKNGIHIQAIENWKSFVADPSTQEST